VLDVKESAERWDDRLGRKQRQDGVHYDGPSSRPTQSLAAAQSRFNEAPDRVKSVGDPEELDQLAGAPDSDPFHGKAHVREVSPMARLPQSGP
jgi:hypothetical protein